MTIENDIQKLEVGEKVILYELDMTSFGGDVLRFHGYNRGSIWWQDNEYTPWAIEAKGFGKTGDSQQFSPTLTVGNIGQGADGSPVVGIISAMCLQYDDLVGAKLTRRMTLGKYLDAKNFDDGNASADPDEHFADEIWYIETKTTETRTQIEFSLKSNLDLNGQQLPGVKIIASHCQALRKGGYRGSWCGYTGSAMYDKDDNPTTDPTQDKCAGLLSSCKVRFGEYEVINFCGAPSADKVRGY